VAESICCDKDLSKGSQIEACFSKYSIMKVNNPANPCQLWPSDIPELPGVDESFKKILRNITWSYCIPDT
jgi:hypothetical protein